MKIISLILFLAFINISTHSQTYPPPSCISYSDGSLTICPPDSVPVYTGGLIGYNLYVNDNYVEFIPNSNPTDTVTYIFDPLPDPGSNSFCAKALYQNWISGAACDTALLYYGHPLPFSENWESQSFNTNSWIVEDDSWIISPDEGNPFPAAAFLGQAGLTNYSKTLASFPFLGDTLLHGFIYLDFDLRLNCLHPTGEEALYVQSWNWTNRNWENLVTPITNENGGFDWTPQRINITTQVQEEVFRIRFVAAGMNSTDISGWFIDNVMIHRTCIAPQDLETIINPDNEIELFWTSACCGSYTYPLSHITYGLYTSIGTGGPAEFDVAARWTPGMLQAVYDIYSVDFVPGESDASYSIRIWQGDSATLVYDQPVEDFTLNEWNLITLDIPQPVDNSQMLWVGYHVETSTGYPAGVDNGPAYNGWGNMMFWEGQWSTLLEINPELNYNWNIIAYAAPQNWYCGNRVYRSVNNGDYDLIADIPMWGQYVDEEADPNDLNCYLVTDVRAYKGDTCESDYSNESCTLPIGFGENPPADEVLVYPNPAHDQVTIESSSMILKIQVMDLTGRIIRDKEVGKKSVNIPTGSVARGVILIRIFTDDGVKTRKVLLIKQ